MGSRSPMMVKAHVSPGFRAKTRPHTAQRSRCDRPEKSWPSPQWGQRLRSPRRSAVPITLAREGVIHRYLGSDDILELLVPRHRSTFPIRATGHLAGNSTSEANFERAGGFLPASHAVEEVLHVRVGGIRIVPGRGRPVFGRTCGLLALRHVARLVGRIVNDRT